MAVSVDWGQKIINVPKADMTLIQSSPTEIRQLDLNVFRLVLKDLEDDADGMAFERTHRHNTTVEVGGVILARVIEIINGYTVTFEDGQYAVNLVGANSNVGDVVNVNQVSVRSSNSAGLQDLNSLQAASYDSVVTLDSTSTYSGTVFPVGIRQYPVNNLADAKQIAIEHGLRTIVIPNTELLASEDFSSGYVFHGENATVSTAVLLAGVILDNCEFNNIVVTGVTDSRPYFRQCQIGELLTTFGLMFQCAILGPITLYGTGQYTFLDCYSGIAGNVATPVIDMGGSGSTLAIRGYAGGLTITNCADAAANSSIDMNSGTLILDATITAGTFTIRGVADVVDNTTGTAVVNNLTVNKTLAEVPANTWGYALP